MDTIKALMGNFRNMFKTSRSPAAVIQQPPEPEVKPDTLDERMDQILEQLENGDPRVLIIEGMGDGFLRIDEDYTWITEKAETLIVMRWDMNGVYYNLDSIHFPKVKNIILLNSHPCEYGTVSRWKRDTYWFSNNWHRWFMDLENFMELNKSSLDQLNNATKGRRAYHPVRVTCKDYVLDGTHSII
jgi:hypothetical protein